MDNEKILVPRAIYESIENVLEAQVKKLAIQIAQTLNVNEKVLLQELKKDKISVMLLDEINPIDVDSYSCKAYEKYENVYIPCEDPVVYKKEFCTKHMIQHLVKDDLLNNECLFEVIYDGTKYYKDKNNKIYDSSFNKIGYYIASSETIVLLVVAGEDSE